MNKDYIKYLFKFMPFDCVVDYMIMSSKIKIINKINEYESKS